MTLELSGALGTNRGGKLYVETPWYGNDGLNHLQRNCQAGGVGQLVVVGGSEYVVTGIGDRFSDSERVRDRKGRVKEIKIEGSERCYVYLSAPSATVVESAPVYVERRGDPDDMDQWAQNPSRMI